MASKFRVKNDIRKNKRVLTPLLAGEVPRSGGGGMILLIKDKTLWQGLSARLQKS
jgi:hypothetical protein